MLLVSHHETLLKLSARTSLRVRALREVQPLGGHPLLALARLLPAADLQLPRDRPPVPVIHAAGQVRPRLLVPQLHLRTDSRSTLGNTLLTCHLHVRSWLHR